MLISCAGTTKPTRAKGRRRQAGHTVGMGVVHFAPCDRHGVGMAFRKHCTGKADFPPFPCPHLSFSSLPPHCAFLLPCVWLSQMENFLLRQDGMDMGRMCVLLSLNSGLFVSYISSLPLLPFCLPHLLPPSSFFSPILCWFF